MPAGPLLRFRSPPPVKFLSTVVLAILLPLSLAAEPLLKRGDVVALVGGEDMVAAAEQGELELLLVRELPAHRLKLRCLAWEGDTVFEQPRELNYPTLEQQLEETAATVVLADFGLMESLAGPAGIPKFIAAYEKLLERFGPRRAALLLPRISEAMPPARQEQIGRYASAIRELASRRGIPAIATPIGPREWFAADKLHLSTQGHQALARAAAAVLCGRAPEPDQPSTEQLRLADAIRAKNKLWYHYARPQNWAFLNGDRTVQPSSRDHLDPSKRWFPEEMKQWLPLIAQKEDEIWKLAAGASPR